MKKIIFSTLFVLSVIFAFAGPAAACTCLLSVDGLSDEAFRERVVNESNDSMFVFSGKAVGRDRFSIKFEIEKVYRGDIKGKSFSLSSGAVERPDGQILTSSCDFNFAVGKSYLVFAQGATAETAKASNCSLTGKLDAARRTISVLDFLLDSEKSVSLLHLKGDFLDNYSFYEPDIHQRTEKSNR